MTRRKEAIKCLKSLVEVRRKYGDMQTMKDEIECLEMAIKALEQEPCEDAVSRQEVLYLVGDYDLSMGQVVKGIHALPPVTPQPKMGRWITKDGKEQGYDIGGVKTWYIQIMCSECGFIKTAIEGHTGQYHYCPNCGAKMQEVEE